MTQMPFVKLSLQRSMNAKATLMPLLQSLTKKERSKTTGTSNQSYYYSSFEDLINHRRYKEPLFDILIAGGMLSPGGIVSEMISKYCVFTCEPTTEDMRGYLGVIKIQHKCTFPEYNYRQ